MGELGVLFNPGMRHEIAERQSRESRREEEGNATDGDDLRIDLLSGIAVINLADEGSDTGDRSENAADDPDSGDDTEEDIVANGGTNGEDTPTEGGDSKVVDAVDSEAADDASAGDAAEGSGLVDTGSAPSHGAGFEPSDAVSRSAAQEGSPAESDADQDALDIARSSSNDEPPA